MNFQQFTATLQYIFKMTANVVIDPAWIKLAL